MRRLDDHDVGYGLDLSHQQYVSQTEEALAHPMLISQHQRPPLQARLDASTIPIALPKMDHGLERRGLMLQLHCILVPEATDMMVQHRCKLNGR
jgi:hypothetical protein